MRWSPRPSSTCFEVSKGTYATRRAAHQDGRQWAIEGIRGIYSSTPCTLACGAQRPHLFVSGHNAKFCHTGDTMLLKWMRSVARKNRDGYDPGIPLWYIPIYSRHLPWMLAVSVAGDASPAFIAAADLPHGCVGTLCKVDGDGDGRPARRRSQTVRSSGQDALSPWKALLSQCFEILGVCACST